MTTATYTTTGAITARKQLILDTLIPLPDGRVRVTIEPIPDTSDSPDFLTHLKAIHATLQQSGHQPPTAEEVTRRIQSERDSWQD